MQSTESRQVTYLERQPRERVERNDIGGTSAARSKRTTYQEILAQPFTSVVGNNVWACAALHSPDLRHVFDEVLSAFEDLLDGDNFACLFVLSLEDLAIGALSKALLKRKMSLNFFVGDLHGV